MRPERWQAVKRLFEDVLRRVPAERDRCLADAAKTDPELADEVRALLSAHREAGDFLCEPARVEETEPATNPPSLARLAIGKRLGPYEILSFVGAGGMGEVYKARDTRLDRAVAIKVLPPDVSEEPAQRRRFEREARTISKLSHPHICPLYDVGEQDGRSFLVMEYLEGESLSDRLTRGPLPLEEALRCAQQIAEALEEAHQHGIVHRDLKPGNVMLTRKGAKLLDFGVAKLRPAVVSEDAATATASELTAEGLIVGTPQYMAPEQIEGKPVDARTDIFAFGALIYEMVTGRKAFEASSRASLIVAILEREPPPLSQFQPLSPPWLDALVKRCLAKRPADRWQSCGELLAQLDARRGGEGPGLAQGRRQRPRQALWTAGALAVILAGLTLALVFRAAREPPLTERDAILLSDVTNNTGEAVFDGTLRQALAIQLEQSPFLRIVPDEQVRETLRFMGHSPDAAVSGDLARQVCRRRGIKALLGGSLRAVGSSYVADLAAILCESGEALAREQVEAARKEDVLPVVGGAASRLRRKLGESLPSIERYDARLDQATTSSLEGFRAFTLAERQRVKGGDAAAVPFYRRAIELDPEFALAYARVALMYRNLGESQLAAEYAREAFARRSRVSERERFYIEVRYYFDVTGEFEKVRELNRLLAEAYPRDGSAANNVAINYQIAGEHEEALKWSLEAVRRDPDNHVAQTNLGTFYTRVNRLDEARQQYEKALTCWNRSRARRGLFELAFIRGDQQAMQQHREAMRGKPGEWEIVLPDARASAFEGKWRAAERLYERAVDLARASSLGRAGEITGEEAMVAAVFGMEAPAIRLARRAAKMSPNPHGRWSAAVALALSGASAEAQRLIQEISSEYPRHTLVQTVALPSARAAMELRQGRPAAAIDSLAPATRYELSDPPWFGLPLLPVYLRGEAFLTSGAGAAAAEFQKIIDHRGLNAGSPLWSLAHLWLGRAHAAAGDVDHARQAYAEFLAMWKDADPDVPILREAREESARLTKPS